jgi:CubicO group peptidase (beta-lactamase class C family)
MMAFAIGMLQEDGTINLDNKVNDYLAPGWSLSPDTEADITIRHLVTMTSGLNDRLEYIGRPGEIWRYSHAAYKILYEVIKSATGGSARDLFNNFLFSRIGMKSYTWSGYDVASSPREIARFGLLMLNRGVWQGEKLLNDEGYFSDMLTTSQSLQESYGYLWWLNGSDSWYDDDKKVTVPGPLTPTMPSDAWMAKGFHEQRIYIVPSLEMVVIRQGEYTGLPEAGEGSFDAELWRRLMNAVKKNSQ